jgi:uncharacterized transporter YbjL
MHTVTGAVRVKVLDGKVDGKRLTALDIAWHYDIVITTLQRLSTEGSPDNRSSSALTQVRGPKTLIKRLIVLSHACIYSAVGKYY